MANNLVVLLSNSIKGWISARGFIMVIVAALVPLLLTGAWVATHQADVAAEEISWDPNPMQGQRINITAMLVNKGRFDVGPFNATLTVGTVSSTAQGPRLVTQASNATQIDGMQAGESREIRMNWTTRSGVFLVLADADTANVIAEIEEFNNQKPKWLEVAFSDPDPANQPRPRGNLTGSSGPEADLEVTDLQWDPETRPFTNATYSATIRNNGPEAVTDVNVTLQIGQAFGGQVFPSRENKTTVSLGPGEEATVSLVFNDVTATQFWLEAFVNTTGTASDPNGGNNWMAEYAPVQPKLQSTEIPEPPERLTIKRFYLDILQTVQIPLLIPFIALFYAAGSIADDRAKGNLVYILTRPVPRGAIPLVSFAVSYVVAGVAVTIGILAAFFLLLGTPEGNLGFLTTPLLISYIGLVVYGALFALVGIMATRPYLVGLGIIGWEWLVVLGRNIEVEDRPFLADWVQNFTLSHHLIKAISGWRLDVGLAWLPESSEAQQALGWVLGAAVVFLVAAVVMMRNKEFDL